MATNAASSNPIGFRTGPVTSSVPPVPEDTIRDIEHAAEEEVLQPHLRDSHYHHKESTRERDENPVKKTPGTGNEITERAT